MPGQTQSSFIKWSISSITVITLGILLYLVPRNSFTVTFSLFAIIFSAYTFIVKREDIFSFRFCITLAIILRVLALFSLPALSDDYFRFIWDGKMSLQHVNPFQYTPREFLETAGTSPYLKHLYASMNSQKYHTIYPPILQYIFAIAAYLGNGNDWMSVLIMKIFILASEIVTMRILYLLIKQYGVSTRQSLWYILNPLIIIELTGNVHFEAILIFFFVLFLHFLNSKKLAFSAIFWMLSICTKMIPLMLAPLILRYLKLRKSVIFGVLALVTGSLLFIPFLNSHLLNDMGASLRLFFHLFEFNASVLYVIRWIGYFYVDYDIIEQAAPILGLITFICVLFISFWPSKRISLIDKSLWVFSIYFLLSSMVHPWYVAILVVLSSLTRYSYPIAFSFLIMLSYYPYSMKVFNEETGLWWIMLEYGSLFIYITWELLYLQRRKINRQAIENLKNRSEFI